MNERENVLGNEETQNTQLELDILTSSIDSTTQSTQETETPTVETVAETCSGEQLTLEDASKAEKECKGKKCKKACKCGKFFAWLFTLLSIACAVVPFASLLGPNAKPIENTSLLNGFFAAAANILNINLSATAPQIFSFGLLGKVYGFALLALPVIVLLSVILAIAASCSKKNPRAAARAIAVINFAYFFSLSLIFSFMRYKATGVLNFDLVTLAGAGAMMFLTLCLLIAEPKVKSFFPFTSFVLASAIAASYCYGSLIASADATQVMFQDATTRIYMLAVFGFGALVVFVALMRLIAPKNRGFDVFFSIVTLIVTIAILVGAFVFEPLKGQFFTTAAIISVACALLQLIFNAISRKVQKAIAVEALLDEIIEALPEETEAEEAAPAEDDGLVAMEDIDPTTKKYGACGNACAVADGQPTASEGLVFGSSYMKNKQAEMGDAFAMPFAPTQNVSSYDWFLESLTADERQEFVYLFVCKNLSGTATLPNYVAGGDN